MNLADVFTVTFIILGFLIVYVGYWLMAAGLFPRLVERCADQIGRAPIKSTLVGAITFIPLVVLGFAISNKAPNGAGKMFGLAIVGIAALAALLGSAGLALRIGQGLKSERDEREPWRRVLRGGIILGLTFVMPFLGTPAIMGFSFIIGFGALVLSRPKRQPAPVLESTPAPIPPAASTVSLS
jgi:hypothetical protein